MVEVVFMLYSGYIEKNNDSYSYIGRLGKKYLMHYYSDQEGGEIDCHVRVGFYNCWCNASQIKC